MWSVESRMAADPGLSMGHCLENREGGIKRDLRNRGDFVWIPHPTNQLCRLTPETAGETWIGPGHLGSRDWQWIWQADSSIMAVIKHGQCHQSQALSNRACVWGRLGKEQGPRSFTVSRLTAGSAWSWRARWMWAQWRWSRWTMGNRWTPEEKQGTGLQTTCHRDSHCHPWPSRSVVAANFLDI